MIVLGLSLTFGLMNLMNVAHDPPQMLVDFCQVID